jgi:hypothetical protein
MISGLFQHTDILLFPYDPSALTPALSLAYLLPYYIRPYLPLLNHLHTRPELQTAEALD